MLPTTDPLLDYERLAAVADLSLDDAGQQEVFGHLNDLALQLLGAPVSVVSLVTGSRQVSVGQSGLSSDRTSHMELPLTHALCTQVAQSGEALIIENAHAHPAFADHLGVRDLDIVAYAGAPLRLAGGEVVGAFCAIDSQPRSWSPEDLETLAKLTEIASTLMDQRRRLLAGGLRDAVTGLPRLPLFHEHLRQLLVTAEPHEQVAVVALDLRGFSLVNEAWGHAGGDAVLADVGLRLEQFVNRRRVAGHVCRLAGDTFLLAGIVARTEPRDRLRLDALAAVTSRPVRHGDDTHLLSARAATVFPGAHAAPEQITEAAKAAVRSGADTGDLAVPANGSRRLTIGDRLWTAQRNAEFELHYQPIYDLAANTITGFEALLRWNSPELGAVSPAEFIPEAERSGAIVPIGEWVLQQGLRDLVRWRRSTPGRDLTLSVNVAPEQLLVPTFAGFVQQTLDETGLPGEALVVEVTERTLGEHSPAMISTLEDLRARGVRVSVDDFGTGYSSLSRLADLPLDEIKIDRSFVAAMDSGTRARDLVASIIAMAHSLGLSTLAEGIETTDQHRRLAELGCTHAQGYLMARPAPASSFSGAFGEA